jgi:hypothetical protein
MLCEVPEIRWIPIKQLECHPLHHQSEAHLLLNPEQWICVFARTPGDLVEVPVFNPSMKEIFPLTMFLEFNLYGYLQRHMFASENRPSLLLQRMGKCSLKIIQHIHFLETGNYESVQALKDRLEANGHVEPSNRYALMIGGFFSTQPDKSRQDRAVIEAIYQVILELDRVHSEKMNLVDDCINAAHHWPDEWTGTPLGDFLKLVAVRFGGTIRLAGFKSPYKQYHTKLFFIIDPETSIEQFHDFVVFARPYYEGLVQQKVFLNATTRALLTSQFYSLWSHVALEGHILLAQSVYAPQGGLSIKIPEEQWTLQKIRESVSVFEEFYLPLITSPQAKGHGMDFCKIYERAETEMLFHYYCYLKDRDDYLAFMEKHAGSIDDVIAHGCAKYGNEIGIQNWHPFKFIDSYPFLKRMIRQIDDMALGKLENQTSAKKFSF